MNVDDDSNVSRDEAELRQVTCHDGSLVFYDLASHHFTRGLNVTKRGALVPVSICQTVRTRIERPFGEISSPSTWYFMPYGVAISVTS